MSEAPEETTTIRVLKSNHAKLKRVAALEGMTMFELMDGLTNSCVAQKEKEGYNLAAPSGARLSQIIRGASRRLFADGKADSELEDAESVGTAHEVSEYEKGTKKGNRRQISHTIDPSLLRWVDETAQQNGMSRAAAINMLIAKGRDKGFFN